jgi:hypothetical protein
VDARLLGSPIPVLNLFFDSRRRNDAAVMQMQQMMLDVHASQNHH